jgi:hypothetical protein
MQHPKERRMAANEAMFHALVTLLPLCLMRFGPSLGTGLVNVALAAREPLIDNLIEDPGSRAALAELTTGEKLAIVTYVNHADLYAELLTNDTPNHKHLRFVEGMKSEATATDFLLAIHYKTALISVTLDLPSGFLWREGRTRN